MKVQKLLALHHTVPAHGCHSLPSCMSAGLRSQTEQPPLLQGDGVADG